eukprot:scaffold11799_cov63-Phaeocystis_antarctica.AAC.4
MAARYETLQEDEVIVPSGMARVTFGVRTVGPFCRRGVPPRPPQVFYADLTTQLDAQPPPGSPTLRPGQGLDLFHDVQAFDHLSEGDVLAIEPLRLAQRDEELGAVGVRPAVGHGHDAGARVLEVEVLVVELRPVDGLGARAVVVREVSAVDDELLHHAMEEAALVAVALLASAQCAEVLSGHGRNVWSQLYHDPAQRSAVRRQVKVNLRQGWERCGAGSHGELVTPLDGHQRLSAAVTRGSAPREAATTSNNNSSLAHFYRGSAPGLTYLYPTKPVAALVPPLSRLASLRSCVARRAVRYVDSRRSLNTRPLQPPLPS